MKSDKQTENNAQIFFRNVIEETGFIDKLRTVTQVIKGRLSQHDTRNAEKIVYPYEYLFTVILLAGMAGYKTKDEVRVFWRANSDFFSKVFPDLFGDIPSTSTIKYMPLRYCQCVMCSPATDRPCALQTGFSLTAAAQAESR